MEDYKENIQQKTEILMAYDEHMSPVGEYPRSEIHYRQMWHRVAQCWIVGLGMGKPRIFLQRRSFEKLTHPGRYDVTAGGHVMSGETPAEAIVREIQEETGLILKPEHLHPLGEYREIAGHDHEMVSLFVHFDVDPPFRPGPEVIYMVSADLEDFRRLSEGLVDAITVTPAIRTGPMKKETFSVQQNNFCNHSTFLKVVYPYLKRYAEDHERLKKRLMDGSRYDSVPGRR